MKIPQHNIKMGDLLPAVRGTLTGIPSDIDITGKSIKFHMKNEEGILVIDKSATIVDAAAKKVKYDWDVGETDTPGWYTFEFELDIDGRKFTFPNNENGKVFIFGSLDNE